MNLKIYPYLYESVYVYLGLCIPKQTNKED